MGLRFPPRLRKGHNKIHVNQWIASNQVSMKAPTCALIEPDGETLFAFGYEAEDKYAELAADDSHRDWYFFKRFKMMLFEKTKLQRDVMLTDSTGKEKKALDVFSLAIKYLMDDLLTNASKTIAGRLTNDDIRWVLTVPAIWNDIAKQFMREAARKAGISDKHLIIALEPEAASLVSGLQSVEKLESSDKMLLSKFKAGTKYMVVDAGGGTVDITVHEVTPRGGLKEIHVASGGDWGGTKVDDAFEQLFIDLLGARVWQKFKRNDMEGFIDLLRDIDTKKRTIREEDHEDKKISIQIPVGMREIFEEETRSSLKSHIEKHPGPLNYDKGKLRMNTKLAKGLFQTVIESALVHLQNLMEEPAVRDISLIVMVGGFSESPMLQSAVKKAFPNIIIVVPKEAGLAVLKGAVVYGNSPISIESRVCRYTYGVDCELVFKDNIHPERNRVLDKSGIYRCIDGFSIHATKGQSVSIGEFQEEQIYFPFRKNQTSILFDIFASVREKPVLVTDPGCFKLGTIIVDIPDTRGGLDRKVSVKMCFSGTEIEVEGKNEQSGDVCSVRIDMLS